MYLPRWIVVLLFVTSIGSLSTVMYLLAFREKGALVKAVPQATVIVSSAPVNKEMVSPTPVAQKQEDVLMADAKWEKVEEKSLNVRLEYPQAWTVKVENGVLLVSDPKSLTKNMTLSRANKANTKDTTEVVVKTRKEVLVKDDEVSDINEEKLKVNEDYDGVILRYRRGDVAVRELVFVTRSYVYTAMMIPDVEEMQVVWGEIVKSIGII